MRKGLIALALVAAVLAPGVASADSSTDAALGLAAFAVFNQFLGGWGYVQPAPPPPQIVIVNPPPPPVILYEYNPAPPVYQYYAPPPAWCPPGLAKKGRC